MEILFSTESVPPRLYIAGTNHTLERIQYEHDETNPFQNLTYCANPFSTHIVFFRTRNIRLSQSDCLWALLSKILLVWILHSRKRPRFPARENSVPFSVDP